MKVLVCITYYDDLLDLWNIRAEASLQVTSCDALEGFVAYLVRIFISGLHIYAIGLISSF